MDPSGFIVTYLNSEWSFKVLFLTHLYTLTIVGRPVFRVALGKFTALKSPDESRNNSLIGQQNYICKEILW
jgi:hypothetical protein